MIRILSLLLCTLVLAVGVPRISLADENGAKAFINDIAQQTLSIAADKTLNLPDQRSKLEGIFAQNADLDWVSKFVLGKYWRDATDDQKTRFMAAYREFELRSYSSKFDDYNENSFKITDAIDQGNGRYLVRMIVNRPRQEPITVDYHVKQDNNAYKVFDLTVEGVSMITSQRSEITAAASRMGLEGLIADLKKKAEQLNAAGKK